MGLNKKLEFFIESKHAMGRTALVLSGGGYLGMFHFGNFCPYFLGIIKVLQNYDAIPEIISGSSAGSIVAAFIGGLPREKLLKINSKDGEINWRSFQQRD